ncbi:hypothetical protein SIID45300_01119 [Candidatus Magnetaquicoccaceae bacterium FCR-1]|uniref:Calcium-binding protein n=1 Tax=Candidatus Magnetaquiglobus chichijimensis TaxID=3141448 RepID=A0ABQ0C7D6_9PROT
MHGTSKNDLMVGTSGDDHLWGGNGNDTFLGRGGDDDMFGQAGNDLFIFGNAQSATVDGGQGKWTDIIDLTDKSLSMTGHYDGGWTAHVDDHTVTVTNATQHGVLDHLDNASGSITFNATGDVVHFQNIDKIEW